ncbi:hypothetical protein [Paraburkholderia saeva]|uniref:Holin n=1 Tax=Paraburkholderia saeva TaxID=2777537 RepID=A0A9N8RW91_9BURK|nr:hypothetical protein [Paraburkholderia saeva]CAG4900881.1 hypothetical protein LMG31841_02928 [Paraburkholderia saeva]
MHKEIVGASTNGAISATGIGSSWWLWVTDPNSAHIVTILTVALIISQLIWGWRKFFKEKRNV